MRGHRHQPQCEDQTGKLRAALRETHATARAVQRELIEGLPPHEDQAKHVRRIRDALDGKAEEKAESAIRATDNAASRCLEREDLRAALKDEERVVEQAEEIVGRGEGDQETVDTLWGMGTDWDPGEPMRRAERALSRPASGRLPTR